MLLHLWLILKKCWRSELENLLSFNTGQTVNNNEFFFNNNSSCFQKSNFKCCFLVKAHKNIYKVFILLNCTFKSNFSAHWTQDGLYNILVASRHPYVHVRYYERRVVNSRTSLSVKDQWSILIRDNEFSHVCVSDIKLSEAIDDIILECLMKKDNASYLLCQKVSQVVFFSINIIPSWMF